MKRFLPSLFLVSLMALQLLAMPKKEMLALDFTAPNAYSICATDITKLQGADFPDRVKALKVGDELLMKTAEAVYTGRVTLAYRDVNMTEVRAGYFNHHNLKNNEIWHVTFDKDYMVGWLENTYLAKDYSFLYNMNTEVISSLNLTQEDFSCGNDQEVSNLKLSEEQAAEAKTFSSGVRAGEPYYTNYWQNPEYVTQTYLVCFTKEAYQDQLAKGGINNMIAHGVAHGTLLLSNSNVRACLKLVHTEMVPYENHGDSSRSLGDFAGYRNGMEGTYDMRSRYGADMCSIGIKRASSTGLAYVSGGVTGSESSSFSCMDSGFMAATGWIHESGHTMGGRHYIDTYSPGSSSLFNHSFGCHNTPPGAQREQGSVMARSSGLFNYFSSTNIYYDGVPISTNVKCRVADTWQKVRLYASRYRSFPTLPELADAISCENFEYQDDAELMFQDGGVGFASPWYHCNTNVFRIVNDGAESYLRVYNTNVFSCLASRFLHWGRGINPSYEYFLSNIWLRASLRLGAKSSCTLDLNAPTFNFSQGKVRINNLTTTSKDVPLGEKFDFVVLLDTQSDAQHRNATFYAWINPPTDSEPSKESADIVLTRSTSTAFRNLRQLRLTAAANTEDSFDLYSFNLGFSFASLFPPVHPKKFSVVPGNYTNETIRLVWEKQGTPNAYKIFRGLSNNFACATEIGTAAAEAETFEDKTPNQGVRYFYWLQTLYTNYTFTSLSRRGVAGIPIVSACANGPYVIGQGQIARFKADGSLGFNPMIRWTVDGYPSPYLTNHYYFSYNEHQTMIPGVYPVSIFVSEQEVDTPVYTDETTLTVTNSYPSVVITCLSEHIMEGNNLLFLATPSDPGTNDTLTVRWNFGDGSAWSDFTNGYYAVHNFATQGVYNISCEVKDNYGAVTCQTLSLDVSAGSGLPVVPTELVLENGHSGILKLGNLGSKAYNFSVSSTSAFLKINPASGTVAGGVSAFTPLLLTFDHAKAKGIGGTFFLNLTANGETQTISITVPTTPVQIAIQEPKTILRDWVSDFSALGTQPGYKTRWLLDGEQLAPDSEARVLRTVPNLSAGGHTLALLALDEENQICAAVTNELTVIERAPDVFLEEKARDDSTVTYNPVVLGAGTGFTEIRYDWGDGNGWTTWLPVEEISHDFLANKKYFVRCQISCAGVVNETSLLYNPELALTVNATFTDLNTNYLECAVGERVKIKLQAEEGTKTFWRENFSNPALGLLENETATSNFAQFLIANIPVFIIM